MNASAAARAEPTLVERFAQLRAQHIRLARTNIRAFVTYVMRDEATGGTIDMSPTQEAWHRLADRYDRLVLWSYPEAGKSFQMSVARTLWELGQNPALRFAIVSATSGQAAKIARLIATYIERSPELHDVFPELQPDPNGPWNSSQLKVRRRGGMSKDPSVQVVGMGSNIQGARLNRVVLDDVLTRDNTHTKYMRDGCWDWYHKTLPGRLSPVDGRVLSICNVWNSDDMNHRFVMNPLWHGFKFPIQNPDGSSAWPERWSPERIAKRRIELGPIESQIQLDCVPVDDASARFKREWINVCLARGNGKDPCFALRSIPPGCRVFCGVDLGVGRNANNDLTVLFVLLIHPNGTREVLWVESGRWKATEIIGKVIEFHRRFYPIFVVENVAAQDYLVQIMQESTAVPILPFTTGNNKADPTFGLEAMGVELASAKWIIPNRGGACVDDIQQWIGEMIAYNPNDHTGDRLMASWFAKEGCRLGQPEEPPPVVGGVKLKLSKW